MLFSLLTLLLIAIQTTLPTAPLVLYRDVVSLTENR